MDRIIKTIPVENGELFEISGGNRSRIAYFSGRIEILEHTNLIPMLGRTEKGTKTIHASFIICENPDFQTEHGYESIHSGKVYESLADVENQKISFAGMRFEDSDPINGELTFEISDRELVQKLLAERR